MKDVRKFMQDLEQARKNSASQKLPRLFGTVTGDAKEWCVIKGDDGGEYTTNIKTESCGPLKNGQRVSFEPVRDCGFLQNVAVEVKVE